MSQAASTCAPHVQVVAAVFALWLNLRLAFAGFLDRIREPFGGSSSRDIDSLYALRSGPRSCALVIDASGSMADTDWYPSRLEAARQSAKTYCKRLRDEEPAAQVAVIAYGDSAQLMCPLIPALDYDLLCEAVDNIDIIGCTNMTAGIKQAHSLLRGQQTPCQIVVLTDGHHNMGRGPQRIASSVRSYAILKVVGIGGSPEDIDEALCKSIASPHPDGTKRYRWIGDKEQLIQHFHELAGGITRE